MTRINIGSFSDEINNESSGLGCLRGPSGNLPLKAMSAHAHISGMLYTWNIQQTFKNTSSEFMEAIYIFPLPPRAAVTSFELTVGGRHVKGDIQERGEARAQYAQALKEGKRAAIMEEERADVFTVQVGNIPKGEEAIVILELTGPIPLEAGFCELRLPLVVAPRYIPGKAIGDDVGTGTMPDTDAVPDASRISPPVLIEGFPNPVQLDMSMSIDSAGLQISEMTSSLPVDELGKDHWKVVPGQRLNKDFILRYRVHSERLETCATVVKNSPSGKSTINITIVPPLSEISKRARDVVLMIDNSGSMGGWKMVAARRAASRMVDALDSDDRFSVLAFNHMITCPDNHNKTLHVANDRERFRGITFLSSLEASGGTEMTSSLTQAFQLLSSDKGEEREKILVLITDAQIGDEDRLIKSQQKGLADTRVVALGIDKAVNEGLLQKLTKPNKGWYACVESEDWLDQILAVAAREIQPPVLRDIQINGINQTVHDLTPGPIPDCYPSRPLVLWAKADDEITKINITGVLADGSQYEQNVELNHSDVRAYHAMWAQHRIRDLEDLYVAGGKQKYSKEITTLSLTHKVLSRFTAFVAIDSEQQNVQHINQVTQPVESPEGWAPQASMASMAAPASRARGASYGFSDTSRRTSRRSRRIAAPSVKSKKQDVVESLEQVVKQIESQLDAGTTDATQRALRLRRQDFETLILKLIKLLKNKKDKKKAKEFKKLLAAIKAPANVDQVAATWDQWIQLLASIDLLELSEPTKDRKKRRWWF